MSDMTDERAAEVLAAHNEWRRYNGDPFDPVAPEMGDPAEIGRALDYVVSRLRSQPPAEAQPVAWRATVEGLRKFVTDATFRRFSPEIQRFYEPYKCGCCRAASPSAPVGVDTIRDGRAIVDEFLQCASIGRPHGKLIAQAKDWLADAEAALTKQPAAIGEEIMVNAAHDVYTLPLQPSGLSSGPRFVVHVPGPEQPAAVDGAMVERLAQAVATELYGEPPQPGSNSLTRAMMLPGIKRALTATLAAQQGGTQE